MKTITILTSQTSWYVEYAKKIADELNNQGHYCNLVYSVQNLSGGDICFILSFDKIVSPDFLSFHKHNVVCHASDLPKGKGMSPMSWQILEGASSIPLTMFEATEGVDSGSIYKKIFFDLDGGELIDELRFKLASNIQGMVLDFVNNTEYIVNNAREQEGEETFYTRRRPSDSEVQITSSITDIFPLLQIADNEKYPVYFIRNGQKYTLKCEKS